eukprot:3783156-Prymnesium_polylepis.1
MENAEAVPKPSQHRSFERNLLPAVNDSNAQEGCVWLSRNAVSRSIDGHVHPAGTARGEVEF